MDSSVEDTRKRRGAPPASVVVERRVMSHEDKKLRPERQGQNIDSHKHFVEPLHSGLLGCAIDVETAMSRLVAQDDLTEKLSDATRVKFRAGHTGDATAIASFFKQQRGTNRIDNSINTESDEATTDKTQESKIESSPSSELWLSEALGDEDTPPSLCSLLAHISSTSNGDIKAKKYKQQLGAAVLLTLNWEHNKRKLRVEWFHVDTELQESKVMESRMWLRLSALALMTGSTLTFADGIRIDRVGRTP